MSPRETKTFTRVLQTRSHLRIGCTQQSLTPLLSLSYGTLGVTPRHRDTPVSIPGPSPVVTRCPRDPTRPSYHPSRLPGKGSKEPKVEKRTHLTSET